MPRNMRRHGKQDNARSGGRARGAPLLECPTRGGRTRIGPRPTHRVGNIRGHAMVRSLVRTISPPSSGSTSQTQGEVEKVNSINLPGRIFLSVAIFGLVLIGCSAPPDELTASARSDLERLEEDGAAAWAPDEFESAAASLAAAEAEASSQKLRFAPVRDFRKAVVLLEAARVDISLALTAARDGRRLAEEEARESVTMATTAIEGARTALLLAPVSRAGRGTFDHLDEALDRADVLLEEAHGLMAEAKFRDATRRAEEILSLISTRIRALGDGRG